MTSYYQERVQHAQSYGNPYAELTTIAQTAAEDLGTIFDRTKPKLERSEESFMSANQKEAWADGIDNEVNQMNNQLMNTNIRAAERAKEVIRQMPPEQRVRAADVFRQALGLCRSVVTYIVQSIRDILRSIREHVRHAWEHIKSFGRKVAIFLTKTIWEIGRL